MSSLTQRRCHSHRAERPYDQDQGGNSNFLQDRRERWPGSYFSRIIRVRKDRESKQADAEEGGGLLFYFNTQSNDSGRH